MRQQVYSGWTVGSQILAALRRFPDRTAFAWDGGSITYQGTLDLIARMQAVFMRAGLDQGSRIALISSNRHESWCAGVAAQLCGITTTWLHPLGSLNDQLDQIEDSEADVLAVDTRLFAARGDELSQRSPGLKAVFTLEDASYGTNLLTAADAVGAVSPRDLAGSDNVAALLYTGGTTGKSKGALLRHRDLSYLATAILDDFEIPDNPRYLAIGPISHVTGSKVRPVLMKGGTVHMLKGFDPDVVFATIARERINFTLLVPTMIYLLLDHPGLAKADLSSLEYLLYGASPMSSSRLIEGIERIGPVFAQLYGQTECHPVSVLRKSEHDRSRPELFESCGFPISACQVKILDAEDQEVPVGQAGEICVRAPHMMAEYWKRPEQTAETLKNGWLHTGDIARADERGYLFILDRKKDMVVSGGFNIFPREVEDVLATHPDVAMVAVIGIPHPKWGEAVAALVVPRAGTRPDAQVLTDLVKARKGSAHAPKHIEFVESLPLTGVGKVDKKVLRAKFWAGQKRMVG
jgi:fatty-acyl-CoA synthase